MSPFSTYKGSLIVRNNRLDLAKKMTFCWINLFPISKESFLRGEACVNIHGRRYKDDTKIDETFESMRFSYTYIQPRVHINDDRVRPFYAFRSSRSGSGLRKDRPCRTKRDRSDNVIRLLRARDSAKVKPSVRNLPNQSMSGAVHLSAVSFNLDGFRMETNVRGIGSTRSIVAPSFADLSSSLRSFA